MDVQTASLSAFKYDDEYKYYWTYIPHFVHSRIYTYAFGDCLVNSLYGVYLETPDGFRDKYVEMLSG